MLLLLFQCGIFVLYSLTDKQSGVIGSFIVQDFFYESKTWLMDCLQLLQKNPLQHDGVLSLFTANRGGLSAGSSNHSNGLLWA